MRATWRHSFCWVSSSVTNNNGLWIVSCGMPACTVDRENGKCKMRYFLLYEYRLKFRYGFEKYLVAKGKLTNFSLTLVGLWCRCLIGNANSSSWDPVSYYIHNCGSCFDCLISFLWSRVTCFVTINTKTQYTLNIFPDIIQHSS